jgi:hypothetical protein
MASPPGRFGLVGNLLLAAGLAAFVGGTYWKTLHNVSSDDLEREVRRRQLHLNQMLCVNAE